MGQTEMGQAEMAQTDIASTATATAPADTQRSNWVGAVLLIAVAAAVGWRYIQPNQGVDRVRGLLASAGAEAHDRLLSEGELDLPLQAHPKAPSKAVPTLRTLSQGADTVLLHYWASWCPPCLEELPEIAALAQQLETRGCRMVAVSYDDDWQAHDATLEKTIGTAVPAAGVWLRDPEGQDGDPAKMLRMKMGTEKLPETWVISKGKLLGRFVAGQRWSNPRIQSLLATLCPGKSTP